MIDKDIVSFFEESLANESILQELEELATLYKESGRFVGIESPRSVFYAAIEWASKQGLISDNEAALFYSLL